MLARKVGAKRLSAAIQTGTSSVAVWRNGDNLPRTDTAQRLADTLNWPKLLTIAREGRTGHCERCGEPFINEGGSPKRFWPIRPSGGLRPAGGCTPLVGHGRPPHDVHRPRGAAHGAPTAT